MNTICHVEFEVTDVARAQSFYEGLFGWTFRSFGDEMVVFGQGDRHIGGLQKRDQVRPGSSPTVWFQVADADEMTTRATSLGGTVVKPKGEVPSVGWSAQVSDPDGNVVGFVQFSER